MGFKSTLTALFEFTDGIPTSNYAIST